MHGRTVTAGFCVRSTAAAAPSVEFTRECDFTSGGPGNVGGGNPGLLNWRECSRWAIEEIAFDFGGSEGLTTDPHVTVTRIRPYISNSVQVPLDWFQDADLGNEGVAGDGPRGVPISPNQPLIGKWPLPEALNHHPW